MIVARRRSAPVSHTGRAWPSQPESAALWIPGWRQPRPGGPSGSDLASSPQPQTQTQTQNSFDKVADAPARSLP